MSTNLNDLPLASGVNGSDLVLISQSGAAKLATADMLNAGAASLAPNLTSLAAISSVGFVKFTGSNTFVTVSFTSAGVAMSTAADVTAQRTLLGMGTAALKDTGTGATNVILGNDARLSDARTPTAHTHLLVSITDAGTAASKNVPGAGNATSGQVVLGSDSRLSDTRAPSAHKSSHATGGSDALTYTDIGAAAATHTHTVSQLTDAGTAAAKNTPASGNAAVGEVVLGSDTRLSDTRTPASHTHTVSQITDAGTSATKSVPASGDASSGQVVLGSDSRLTNARTPATHKSTHATGGSDALTYTDIGAAAATHTHTVSQLTDAGTAAAKNVPGAGNATSSQVVLGSDTRLADARTPATHHATHNTGGTDAIAPADIGAATTSHHATHATGGSDALAPSDIGAATATHTHTLISLGAAAAVHTHVVGDVTGLGTMATQAASAVAITGGTISGVTISGLSYTSTVFAGPPGTSGANTGGGVGGLGGAAGNITVTAGTGGAAFDNGSFASNGGFGGNCGIVNVSGGTGAAGNVSGSGRRGGNGGAITLTGGAPNLNLAAGGNAGSINLSGGAGSGSVDGLAGGSLTMSAGGGSLDTTGTGSLQLGIAGTRTTLTGSATADRAISTPDLSGTVKLLNQTKDVTLLGGVQSVSDTVASASVTTTETVFAGSIAIAANSLVVGDIIRVTARGVLTNTTGSGDNLTVKIKAGTVILATSGTNAMNNSMTNVPWSAMLDLVVVSLGAGGSVDAQADFRMPTGASAAMNVFGSANAAAVTIDTTAIETLHVTAQWGAVTSGASITLHQLNAVLMKG